VRIGFSGTRMLHPDDMPGVERWLERVTQGCDECTTGACYGFDAYVGSVMYSWFPPPTIRHRVIVPAFRSQVEMWWTGLDIEVIEMPDDTDYRARNNRILDFSDKLVACADYPEEDGHSRRSGTWMTVRLARGRHITIDEPYILKKVPAL
jgi:hypothetical protein